MLVFPSSLHCRRIRLIALAAGLCCAASAADGDRWLKVTTPHFTVITAQREKEAVAWAAEFSQFIAALQDFIRVNPKRLPPLTMVVFARERDFAGFRPLRQDGSTMEVAGFFSRRPSWAVAGLAAAGLKDETRATIFHEGTHWFLSGFELPNPVWLEEGLAEVFSTFAVEGKHFSWGKAIEPHVLALRTTKTLPLEQVLFLARDDLHGAGDGDEVRTALAYAQSWAFVHYLTFGQRDVPKGALIEYVKRLRTSHPDEAFRQAFGGTYAEVDRKLRDYLVVGRYFVAKQPLAALPAPMAQPASLVEVEDALARLRLAAGRHAEARTGVERALAAAPDNPRVYELQGELEQESGNAGAALAAFGKAIDKGSTDFRPYFELAAAEHSRAGESDGSVRNLTPQRARLIANGYERAINLNPRFRPSYEGLAGLLELVPPGNTEDIKFLELGLRLYPDDGMIRLGLASLAKREGNTERARALLNEVLGSDKHPAHVLGYARRLDASWTQRDVFERVDDLAKDKKYTEAIAVVDEHIKTTTDFALRQHLQSRREHLHVSDLLDQARTAMQERRYDDARAKYNAVLETNASPILKDQVRRSLNALNKRPASTK